MRSAFQRPSTLHSSLCSGWARVPTHSHQRIVCFSNLTPAATEPGKTPRHWHVSLAQQLCAAATGIILAGSPLAARATDALPVIVDLGKVFPSGQVQSVQASIEALEREKGWRVRVLTKYRQDQGPSLQELRDSWQPDARTIVVAVDTSAPNILSFSYGDEVLALLRRPFFSELQARFGNQFFVRDNGEPAAVLSAVGALVDCLGREGGCAVVPGVSEDEYGLTLATSLAGGFVAGFASRLEPQGFVRRKWVWLLLFFPLWGTLFINFGLGPIVSRTSDLLPIVGNTTGFLAAAGLVRLSPMFASALRRD